MKRTKACPTCGKNFSYEIGRGLDRKHCGEKCREAHKKKRLKMRIENSPYCTVDDCNNKQKMRSGGYCEKHYYRLRRNGNLKGPKYKYRYKTGAGYIKLKKDHILSDVHGYVYEHRYVAYKKYGDGKQICYWCGKVLDSWNDVIVDHIDENKQNNKIENLLVVCNNCNRARGAFVPFLKRMRPEAERLLISTIKLCIPCHNAKSANE